MCQAGLQFPSSWIKKIYKSHFSQWIWQQEARNLTGIGGSTNIFRQEKCVQKNAIYE